jgi:hypothetical protein
LIERAVWTRAWRVTGAVAMRQGGSNWHIGAIFLDEMAI